MDDCFHLKKQIEEPVKFGHLAHVSNPKEGVPRVAKTGNEKPRPERKV